MSETKAHPNVEGARDVEIASDVCGVEYEFESSCHC